MKRQNIPAIVIIVVSLSVVVSMALAAQDRFTLKAPNGVAFSEFKGYETWQAVAPSQTDDGVKVILANTAMINAYKEGIPGLVHREELQEIPGHERMGICPVECLKRSTMIAAAFWARQP